MTNRYNLQRFIDAQEPIFDRVRWELERGVKTSHWMWFIFPQIEGLGHSATAQKYAIASRAEAAAYAAHAVLGPRLTECSRLVNDIDGRSIVEILGRPDDLKLRSSMTLFAHVCADKPIFQDIIKKYFDGEFDPLTLDRLR